MEIEVKNLTKKFEDQVVVNKLSLNVPSGKIYGFIGANGAGKTTTMRMMVGLMKPNGGKIKYDGIEMKYLDSSMMGKIGIFISKPNYYPNLTAKENLLYLQKILHKPSAEVDRVLELVRLKHAENKKVREFSLGMKQRLGLAIAFLNNPEVLILDEPTNGLDPKGIFEIRQLLYYLAHDEKRTIFISSHNISEIELLSDRICIIDRGNRIFEGTVNELYAIDGMEYCLKTDKRKETEAILRQLNLFYECKNNIFYIKISKERIPEMITRLVNMGIKIYEVTPNNKLENIYLSLTEKEENIGSDLCVV